MTKHSNPPRLCIMPDETDLILSIFEDRVSNSKGTSWRFFRSIFGPFLSGRVMSSESWRKDREYFDAFIALHRSRLRRSIDFQAICTDTARILTEHSGSVYVGEIARVILLRKLFHSVGYTPTIRWLRRVSLLLRQNASLFLLDDPAPAVILSENESVSLDIAHASEELYELAKNISREDFNFVHKTIWQITFAFVESTAMTVETTFSIACQRARKRQTSDLSIQHGYAQLDLTKTIMESLIEFPPTHTMTFDCAEPPYLIDGLATDSCTVDVNISRATHHSKLVSSMPKTYQEYGFVFGGGERLCPGKGIALYDSYTLSKFLLNNFKVINFERSEIRSDRFFSDISYPGSPWSKIKVRLIG